MLDPATIISISLKAVDLSFKILNVLSQYCKDVKKAPDHARELRTELNVLCGVLTRIKITLQIDPNDIPASEEEPLKQISEECTATLEEALATLEKKVQPTEASGIKRLAWPFKSGDIKKLIEKIHRYRGLLESILQAEQSYNHPPPWKWLIVRHQVQRLDDKVEEILNTTKKFGEQHQSDIPNIHV
jgi:hypothetical protein